jgi:hypothetical protein
VLREQFMKMSFSSRLRDGRNRGVRRNSEPAEAMRGEAMRAEQQNEEGIDALAEPALARGWYASSLDLSHGLEVSDVPIDTLPDDLISGFTKW